MNHPYSRFALALTFIAAMVSTLSAQEKPPAPRTTISIETDPSTFLFKGYAFHVRIKPKNSTRLVLGAGTYGLSMPDFLVDLNEENKDKGWNVRINSAVSFFGEDYFDEANRSWFAGIQTGVQFFKNTNDANPGKHFTYTNLLIMPSVGYVWKPLDNGLYVKPWVGLGYTTDISGNPSTYSIAPVTFFPTVHIGYTL